jgi:hypothetical protein
MEGFKNFTEKEAQLIEEFTKEFDRLREKVDELPGGSTQNSLVITFLSAQDNGNTMVSGAIIGFAPLVQEGMVQQCKDPKIFRLMLRAVKEVLDNPDNKQQHDIALKEILLSKLKNLAEGAVEDSQNEEGFPLSPLFGQA